MKYLEDIIDRLHQGEEKKPIDVKEEVLDVVEERNLEEDLL